MNKTLSFISRAGSVILTTVMSFVILPPVIDADGNDGVNWKNVFAFCAGILSIIIYDRYKNNIKLRKMVFFVIGTLVLLIVCYQVIYIQFSVKCYDIRVITPHSSMKPDAEIKYQYWKNKQEPLKNLLEANDCSSTKIWSISALFLPYYGLIAIYFGILITVVLLLAMVTDLFRS